MAARAAGEAGEQPVEGIEAVHPDGQEVPGPQALGQPMRPGNSDSENIKLVLNSCVTMNLNYEHCQYKKTGNIGK